MPPLPAEGRVPRLVPAPCLRRACDMCATKGRRQGPPPPHTSAPPRVGDEGREGRTAAPPPEDKAARWGGSRERVRDGPHDRARRKHAPCKPPLGGPRGSERRVGRATTGATRHAPHPSRGTSAAPRASAVPATCLRRRKDSEGAPPPPPRTPPPNKERGDDSEGVARGHGGGTEDRPTCQGRGLATSGKKKSNHEQSIPTRQRKKARRRGPKPRRTGGGRGDMGPQGTLVKNPTTGKWGPQRENPPLPPPLQPRPVLASCSRHACDMRATKGRRQGRQGG